MWRLHLYLVACKTKVNWKQRCDAGVSQVAASAATVAESAAGVTEAAKGCKGKQRSQSQSQVPPQNR